MSTTPNINYFSRDYLSLRSDLINWAKTMHPDLLSYMNDSSPDVMLIELNAYVGDMLSFYIDKTFNENFLTTAQARESLVRIANDLGFFNIGSTPSTVPVTLTITVPGVVTSGGVVAPDPTLLIVLQSGTVLTSDTGVYFEILEEVNFGDPTNQTIIPNYDGNNIIINFTIQKIATATAGRTTIQRFYVSSVLAQPFLTVTLPDAGITEVLSVLNLPGDQQIAPFDSDFQDLNQKWFEVRDLVQDTLFVPLNPSQVTTNTQILSNYIPTSVIAGVMTQIPRRFIVRRDVNDIVSLTFGGSVDSSNTLNYSTLPNIPSYTQILNDMPLGQVPAANSTLFIQYRVGGGSQTNVQVGLINTITSKSYFPPPSGVNFPLLQQVRNSLSVANTLPALGGKDIPGVEEIRQSSGKIFSAQDRGVTSEDIQALIENMPPQYGRPFRISYEEIFPRVANMSQVQGGVNSLLQNLLSQTTQAGRVQQAQAITDFMNNLSNQSVTVNGNTILSSETADLLGVSPTLWLGEKCRLYICGLDENNSLQTAYKDVNGNWVSPNDTIKQNLKSYLIEKRVIGDWIDIVDARVVNIQINFTLLVDPNQKQQTLIQALQSVRSYFNPTNWYMDQPIFIDNVRALLQGITGVINVVDLQFNNIFGVGVSSIDPISGRSYQPLETGRYRKNLPTALNTSNNLFRMNAVANTILGYKDTIFEVKYPESDITASAL